jgi:hypothetical protein
LGGLFESISGPQERSGIHECGAAKNENGENERHFKERHPTKGSRFEVFPNRSLQTLGW